MNNSKQAIINRLKTIKGHIGGVEKMIADDKPCADVMVQISAIKSSIHKVGMAIIEQNARRCLVDDSGEESDCNAVSELLEQIFNYTK